MVIQRQRFLRDRAAWEQMLSEKIKLMPAKAFIGLFLAPLLYYVVMTAVSVPPGAPPQSHDHALHQLGMPVIALIGYVLGLAMSLGDEIRAWTAWMKPAHK